MIREVQIIAEGTTIDEVREHLESVMRRALATSMIVMNANPDEPVEGEWDSTKELYTKAPDQDLWVGVQTMRFRTSEEKSRESFVKKYLGVSDN